MYTGADTGLSVGCISADRAGGGEGETKGSGGGGGSVLRGSQRWAP